MYDQYVKDGYRQLITLRCPPGMSKNDLKKWWFDHAERVKIIPGLKLYTIVFTEEETFGPPKPFDGFEVMWFETLKDLESAYKTDIWQKELDSMESKWLFHSAYFQGIWLEGHIVRMKGQKTEVPTQKGLIRLFGALKKLPGMTASELKDWYHLHATMALDEEGRITIPGIIGYTHSFAIRSPYGPPFVDAVCGNWWKNLEEIKRDFTESKMTSQVDHGEATWDYNDLKQAQMTWGEQFVISLNK
jgi:hypothetical protein